MNIHIMYVHIVGEPFLSMFAEYREKAVSTTKAWNEYGKKMGAYNHSSGYHALCFNDGEQPKTWTKPKGRYGFSTPKKNSPDFSDFNAMPRGANPRTVFPPDVFPDSVHWRNGDEQGWSGIEFYQKADLGWSGDFAYGIIGDVSEFVKQKLCESPKTVFSDDILEWELPEGLVKISEARVDFEVAKHKLEELGESINTEDTTQ